MRVGLDCNEKKFSGAVNTGLYSVCDEGWPTKVKDLWNDCDNQLGRSHQFSIDASIVCDPVNEIKQMITELENTFSNFLENINNFATDLFNAIFPVKIRSTICCKI